MRVLQLTAHFKPNIGGVETHLDDLCKALVKSDYDVTVLTYRPLQTKAVWKMLEKEKKMEIIRIPWIPNLFYIFVKNPILEFLYLLPGLFLITPIVLIFKKPEIIHAHGLVMGFVAVFWGKIFGKKIVISTHSIYHFPKEGLYTNFVRWVLINANICMGLSNQAVKEIKSLGIPSQKVKRFTYWIDLNNFKRVGNSKEILRWGKQFTVLFVGRLVPEKGIIELLDSVKEWDKGINLKIIGNGPLKEFVQSVAKERENVEYIGSVNQENLPLYYSGSDILIVPSIAEEGFGRVILESLACGTPVIGADRGAIPDALDSTVGKIIDINKKNIKQTIENFYVHKERLKILANNCRKFAERNYSEKNAETIIKLYRE